MADIFISYSHDDRALIQKLAADLTRRGYSVWWDAELLAGENFRHIIMRELSAAQCVVVVWTPASVQSIWVASEAGRGLAQGKLVSLCTRELAMSKIPQPFDVLHTELVDQRDRVAAAIAKLQLVPGDTPDDLEPFQPEPQSGDTWPDGSLKPDFARPPLAGTEFRDGPLLPRLVVIPAGGCLIGSAAKEAGRLANEGPRHRVRITHRLAVGKYPLTFDEWDYFATLTDAPHRPPDKGWGRGNRPAINVSWDDAQVLCEWLSITTGKTYRLLTEAEWEYCCRAGATTRFTWGDAITSEEANFNPTSHPHPNSANTYRARTTPVGQFPPNAFGLCDMHGNVCEWVQDPWHDDYIDAPGDGRAWNGIGGRRVVRGGSWHDTPQNLRCARRAWHTPSERVANIGLRVCREI